MARMAAAVTLRKDSAGVSFAAMRTLAGRWLGAGLGQVFTKTALVIFRHGGAFQLIALIQERHPERGRKITENLGILRPCDHRSGRHDGRNIAVHKARARKIRHGDHGTDCVTTFFRVISRHFGQYDCHFRVMGQVIQRGNQIPAIKLVAALQNLKRTRSGNVPDT